MLLNEIILLELRGDDIPPTGYGYWIDDQGGLIPVKDAQHDNVAAKMLRLRFRGRESISVQAMEKGWIRVVYSEQHRPGRFEAGLTSSASNKAVQSLLSFIMIEKRELIEAHIAILSPEGEETIHGDFYHPGTATKAVSWLRGHL